MAQWLGKAVQSREPEFGPWIPNNWFWELSYNLYACTVIHVISCVYTDKDKDRDREIDCTNL